MTDAGGSLMGSRVMTNGWWELMAANEERFEDWDIEGVGFGHNRPRRLNENDLKVKEERFGGRTFVEFIKWQASHRGPFKLLRVRRYALVKEGG
jgi:hypothetical protein